MVLLRPAELGSEPGHPDLRSTEAGQRLLLCKQTSVPQERPRGRTPGAPHLPPPLSHPLQVTRACLPPSSYDADQKPGLELAPAEPAYPPAARKSTATPRALSPACRRATSQGGGRDRQLFHGRLLHLGRALAAAARDGGDAGGAGDAGSGGGRAGRAGTPAGGRHRHACAECGKTYATSSNPQGRHKQTHRSLDSQLARQVPDVRQGVRVHARAGHACAHAQPAPQVRRVRQGLLAALAAAGHMRSHTGESRSAARTAAGLRRPLQPARAHADALGLQALPLPPVRQELRAQVLPPQALRGRLRQGGQATPTTAPAGPTS